MIVNSQQVLIFAIAGDISIQIPENEIMKNYENNSLKILSTTNDLETQKFPDYQIEMHSSDLEIKKKYISFSQSIPLVVSTSVFFFSSSTKLVIILFELTDFYATVRNKKKKKKQKNKFSHRNFLHRGS